VVGQLARQVQVHLCRQVDRAAARRHDHVVDLVHTVRTVQLHPVLVGFYAVDVFPADAVADRGTEEPAGRRGVDHAARRVDQCRARQCLHRQAQFGRVQVVLVDEGVVGARVFHRVGPFLGDRAGHDHGLLAEQAVARPMRPVRPQTRGRRRVRDQARVAVGQAEDPGAARRPGGHRGTRLVHDHLGAVPQERVRRRQADYASPDDGGTHLHEPVSVLRRFLACRR
jgi:hypothetical protein